MRFFFILTDTICERSTRWNKWQTWWGVFFLRRGDKLSQAGGQCPLLLYRGTIATLLKSRVIKSDCVIASSAAGILGYQFRESCKPRRCSKRNSGFRLPLPWVAGLPSLRLPLPDGNIPEKAPDSPAATRKNWQARLKAGGPALLIFNYL